MEGDFIGSFSGENSDTKQFEMRISDYVTHPNDPRNPSHFPEEPTRELNPSTTVTLAWASGVAR